MTIEKFDGTHRFLSNFYAYAPVRFEGIDFPTSEHAFQAAKSLDESVRLMFAKFHTSPGWAKRAGREIRPMRSDWEVSKDGIMLEILRAKFAIPSLRHALLETGAANLVEGNNWHDVYWGVCDGKCRTPHKEPEGQNKLGKLLEQVRYEISEEVNDEPI